MALPPPGSAIEQDMLRQARMATMQEWIELFRSDIMQPILVRHAEQVLHIKIRRAPYTDDAWQMLADLGIEPARRRERRPPRNEITITAKHIFFEEV